MNSTLIRLAQRRRMLTDAIANERAQLARTFAPWRTPLAIADQGMSALRFVGRHRALAVGIAAFVTVWKPRWVLAGLRTAWVVWRITLEARHRLG